MSFGSRNGGRRDSSTPAAARAAEGGISGGRSTSLLVDPAVRTDALSDSDRVLFLTGRPLRERRHLPQELTEREAFSSYQQSRPDIPSGEAGWEKAGPFNLEKIDALASNRWRLRLSHFFRTQSNAHGALGDVDGKAICAREFWDEAIKLVLERGMTIGPTGAIGRARHSCVSGTREAARGSKAGSRWEPRRKLLERHPARQAPEISPLGARSVLAKVRHPTERGGHCG